MTETKYTKTRYILAGNPGYVEAWVKNRQSTSVKILTTVADPRVPKLIKYVHVDAGSYNGTIKKKVQLPDPRIHDMPKFKEYLDELKVEVQIFHLTGLRYRDDCERHWPQWIYQFSLGSFSGQWSMGVRYVNGKIGPPKEEWPPEVTREMIVAGLVHDAMNIDDYNLDSFAEEFGITKPSKAIAVYETCKATKRALDTAKIDIDKAWELMQEDGY